jgi:hypothetical protein
MTKQLARVGWALVMLLAFTLLLTSAANAASRTVEIKCGGDIDNVINGDPVGTTTLFRLTGDCPQPFTASATIQPKDGDGIDCSIPATLFPLRLSNGSSAYDPETHCTINGASGVTQVIKPQGLFYMNGIMVTGGTFTGAAATGVGIAEGQMDNNSVVRGSVVTGTQGAGISNAHGIHHQIELTNTTTNPNALGHIGSGIKGINEFNIQYSYVHENQGNGIWCDVYCTDQTSALFSSFLARYNLVVDNGRAGIRWERIGDFGGASQANSGEAIIENNELYGNGTDTTRGAIDIRDAQDALVRNNYFGTNSGAPAIRATDSGRSDRPDLDNIDIVNNILNREQLKGCELPDNIVFCSGNIP